MTVKEPDWNQIVNEIGPVLYRYFCGSFTSAQSADLVQEALIRLVTKCRAGQYLPERASLKTFALGIARYVRLETLKIRVDFELVEDVSRLELCQHPVLESTDAVGQLREAIRLLNPIEQEVLLLMIDEELSMRQIAIILSLPEGTIKSHIHRAKLRLRQILNSQSEVKK